eukprot:TRINITY_DN8183_c0_g1_i1.p1 TRINITY_DN8183_c0_g1~~TRINITY_DN8183_c0_g1_i1.p1  ORF type:complete len:149 (+),score=32.39 TRINITY_DN8183_c0_g1_i1:164-610(+)
MASLRLLQVPDEEIRHIFVYGTLRPDDDTGRPWTAQFADGMTATPAYVPGIRLYIDNYPCVSVPDDDAAPGDTVKGYLMSCDSHDLWLEKWKFADRVEGFPQYYQRQKVEAFPDGAGPGAGVPCFIYHRRNVIKDVMVPDGDWMKRPR